MPAKAELVQCEKAGADSCFVNCPHLEKHEAHKEGWTFGSLCPSFGDYVKCVAVPKEEGEQ